ncbi:MAG TPA: SMC family ATPase [Candidatus Nanoarchaeia archaeon]|nr:SMC family ATPase [Candidatus Nanoarchaeia archaeon]
MLLQELRLENIRSYTKGTIRFPIGSTLLSGDIGSGKSSLLLAVEFALFGTSRPDLPAEALLKKGAVHGSVELLFTLQGQQYQIKRNLKKEKDSIKQASGYVISNNSKKELTAVELKAEILSLLGYPEDLLSKNKNYVFRYTVYCPQEEMRYILQEDPEARLDTLRKIFNIDKYKVIRDNIQLVLRGMRVDIAVLKGSTEHLERCREELRAAQQQEHDLQQAASALRPKLENLEKNVQQQQQDLSLLEQHYHHIQEGEYQLKTSTLFLHEKKQYFQMIHAKLEHLTYELSAYSDYGDLSTINLMLTDSDEKRTAMIRRKTELQERITSLQKEIGKVSEEIQRIRREVAAEEEKKQAILVLTEELRNKSGVELREKQVQDLLDKVNQAIIRNETILEESRKMTSQVVSLDQCPTCFQQVSSEHKQNIHDHEEQKITVANKLLEDFKVKRLEIIQEREKISLQLKEMMLREKKLLQTTVEWNHLLEKKSRLVLLETQQLNLVAENNSLVSETSRWKEEDLHLLDEKIQNFQKIKQFLLQQKDFIQQEQQLSLEINQLEKKQSSLQSDLAALRSTYQGIDIIKKIAEQKTIMAASLQEEKKWSVELAQLNVRFDAVKVQKERLLKESEKMTTERNRLLRLQELSAWLEEYFLNLTYTLEKQVLLNIHYVFNQLFQEWFSILIDSEYTTSRIDDSFTPVIEQDGYEIQFSNLSGGEKTSAALAYRLALNRVINDVIHSIRTKDLLILDEPTDGFSSEQLDKVRAVLERLKLKQTIIVSHESKIESFVENVIRIEKEGMESRIVV